MFGGSLWLAGACLLGAPAQPVDYELRAVAYRERITSLHLEAVVTGRTTRPVDPKADGRWGLRLEVWLDADRHRVDMWAVDGWPHPTSGHWPAEGGRPARTEPLMRTLFCKGCVPDGRWVRYSQPLTVVEVFKPDSAQDHTKFDRDLMDPRGLGHTTFQPPGRSVTQGVLAHPELQYLSAEPARLGEDDTVVVTSKGVKANGVGKHWLVPAKGHSLVRAEGRWGPGHPKAGQLGSLIENTLARDPVSGVWFPKRCRWQIFDEDGQVTHERTTEVRVAELNRPLDPKAFTFAGLSLTPGTLVHDHKAGATRYWSGEKLVDRYTGPPPPELASQMISREEAAVVLSPPPPVAAGGDPTRTPVWVYVLAGGLAVLGGGLLYLALRR